MQRLQRHLTTNQREKLSPDQVENNAGGFVYQVDSWERLQRFLVLGTEGGTFYASERELTRENAQLVRDLLKEDGVRVVDEAVKVSDQGLAYKNDYALFVLALAISEGDEATRIHARENLGRVARIPTHLFTFLEYARTFRGWGRALRRAVADWYNQKDLKHLAYQASKYQQRNGWTHRDAFRVAHPKATGERNSLYRYLVHGELAEVANGDWHQYLQAVKKLSITTDARFAAELIRTHRLPREVVPTYLLTEGVVWEALLEGMGMTAMLRQLATMTRVGILQPGSDASGRVQDALTNQQAIEAARVHPLQVLAALTTYAQGYGARGQHRWQPEAHIVDALDAAFYHSFRNVQPTGKCIMHAIDVSGSMTWDTVGGVPGLTPMMAAAALALVNTAAEGNSFNVAFSDEMVPIAISPRQRLDDVMNDFQRIGFGRTDCALPMLHALEQNLKVDSFVVLTDSETWYGDVHPMEALRRYRAATGINAKLIVVGMVANDFTIADPNDAGSLDVVGFNPAIPQLINNFIQ